MHSRQIPTKAHAQYKSEPSLPVTDDVSSWLLYNGRMNHNNIKVAIVFFVNLSPLPWYQSSACSDITQTK